MPFAVGAFDGHRLIGRVAMTRTTPPHTRPTPDPAITSAHRCSSPPGAPLTPPPLPAAVSGHSTSTSIALAAVHSSAASSTALSSSLHRHGTTAHHRTRQHQRFPGQRIHLPHTQSTRPGDSEAPLQCTALSPRPPSLFLRRVACSCGAGGLLHASERSLLSARRPPRAAPPIALPLLHPAICRPLTALILLR